MKSPSVPTPPSQPVALVTGASRGIGQAIAVLLTSRGYQVVAPSRSELDLSAPSSVDSYLSRHDKFCVDILINNAGVNLLGTILEMDDLSWQTMLQTNLKAALRLIQSFAPGMQQRGWGRILNISSIFSVVTKPRRPAYSMSKAALDALTRSAAVEFGPFGVLVNSLCPGYVDTALTRQNNSAEEIAKISATIPLGRLAGVDELAHVAAFLVSQENTYLTGQNIVVDGGFLCQ